METSKDWKAYGEMDPLWAVASWAGRKHTDANPWTDAEFYALGADWDAFEAAWRQNIGFVPGTVLEIGCGAGRITQMLAMAFQHVTAADVSPAMIDYAKARISAQNITWHATNGDTLPAPDSAMDAVFSCHVFQHFPDNAAQLATLRETFRVLKPGGTFFVHIVVHQFPEVNRSFRLVARLAYQGFRIVQTAKTRIIRQFKPIIHGTSYELTPLFNDLRAIGFLNLGMVAVQAKSGMHTCVFGKKA